MSPCSIDFQNVSSFNRLSKMSTRLTVSRNVSSFNRQSKCLLIRSTFEMSYHSIVCRNVSSFNRQSKCFLIQSTVETLEFFSLPMFGVTCNITVISTHAVKYVGFHLPSDFWFGQLPTDNPFFVFGLICQPFIKFNLLFSILHHMQLCKMINCVSMI
jgi:hypothetical protein